MLQHTTQSVTLKTYIITTNMHKKDMQGTEKTHPCTPESSPNQHHIIHQPWRHLILHQHLLEGGGNKHHHQIQAHLTLQVHPPIPVIRNNTLVIHLHQMTHQIQVPHHQVHNLHPHITPSRRRRKARKISKDEPKTRNLQRKRSLVQWKRR